MGGALVMKHVMSYFQRRGDAVFVIHFTVKAFNQLYITNKTECFSFKSGCAVWVAKLVEEDCPILGYVYIVLQ